MLVNQKKKKEKHTSRTSSCDYLCLPLRIMVEWIPKIESVHYLMKSCVTFFLFSQLMIPLPQVLSPKGGNRCGCFQPFFTSTTKLLSEMADPTPPSSISLMEPFSSAACTNPSQSHASSFPLARAVTVATSLTLSSRFG